MHNFRASFCLDPGTHSSPGDGYGITGLEEILRAGPAAFSRRNGYESYTLDAFRVATAKWLQKLVSWHVICRLNQQISQKNIWCTGGKSCQFGRPACQC